jgi:hypothetical protein
MKFLVLFALLLLCGCGDPAPTPPPPTPEPPPVAEPAAPEPAPEESVDMPRGGLICQPNFHFADGQKTQQGTGFFVAAADGEVLGVTSAHFMDFDGAALSSAGFALIGLPDVLAAFSHSYGPPGNAGNEVTGDLRPDFLLFAGEDVGTSHTVLELDPRSKPEIGEKVWFPNKDSGQDWGHRMLTGKVEEAEAEYSLVRLDNYITLTSQSGSPVISQRTGKVIGTFSRGGRDRGRTVLLLCPSRGILDMIERKPEKIPLAQAIGR